MELTDLQLLDTRHIDYDTDICVLWSPCFLKDRGNLHITLAPTMIPSIKVHTSPKCVFSSRPFTIRAEGSESAVTSLQLMIGVLMTLAAFMISFMRGTPSVTFMDATPAKWKVLSVIWVPGSPMDCAPTAPTVEPIK